jgi:hypothetical protein
MIHVPATRTNVVSNPAGRATFQTLGQSARLAFCFLRDLCATLSDGNRPCPEALETALLEGSGLAIQAPSIYFMSRKAHPADPAGDHHLWPAIQSLDSAV